MSKKDLIVHLAESNKQLTDGTKKLMTVNTALAGKLNQIHHLLVCIGGPLNDNKLGFNKEQIAYLQKIDALSDFEA